eukprot:TRINITY_DN3827_c0_g1_i2.p1 TRINITY_DN3827_c0_g1~~TRINITY_DN3827_c0_g1_i2.p1  ORF type:complete len:830 (+),score=103.66 TRINITY_DN3827_c0_g1_i2:68-2491(+)
MLGSALDRIASKLQPRTSVMYSFQRSSSARPSRSSSENARANEAADSARRSYAGLHRQRSVGATERQRPVSSARSSYPISPLVVDQADIRTTPRFPADRTASQRRPSAERNMFAPTVPPSMPPQNAFTPSSHASRLPSSRPAAARQPCSGGVSRQPSSSRFRLESPLRPAVDSSRSRQQSTARASQPRMASPSRPRIDAPSPSRPRLESPSRAQIDSASHPRAAPASPSRPPLSTLPLRPTSARPSRQETTSTPRQEAVPRSRPASASRLPLAAPRAHNTEVAQEVPQQQVLPKAPETQANEKEECEALVPGAEVCFKEIRLSVGLLLGQGSFGKVWSATDQVGNAAVIKEIKCPTRKQLDNVANEAGVVQTLGDAGVQGIPLLLGMKCRRITPGHDGWRVWLAMTRLPGQQVDHFLTERRARLALDVRHDIHSDMRCLAKAASLAKTMLSQVSPIFQRLNQRVYHRDATARNILVEAGKGSSFAQFSVVDFGLAVDARSWVDVEGDSSGGRWRRRGVSGDGRYWPASAWLLFESDSPDELASNSPFAYEYQHRLDIHSVGIAALQILVESLPNLDGMLTETPGLEGLLASMMRLRTIWQTYWNDVSLLWKGIFQAIQSRTIEHTRAHYRATAAHRHVLNGLCSLRAALKRLQYSAQSVSYNHLLNNREMCAFARKAAADASLVARALLLMLGTGTEPDIHTASWDHICALFCEKPAHGKISQEETSIPSPAQPTLSGEEGLCIEKSEKRLDFAAATTAASEAGLMQAPTQSAKCTHQQNASDGEALRTAPLAEIFCNGPSDAALVQ